MRTTTTLLLTSAALSAALLLAGCASTASETPSNETSNASSESEVASAANAADEMFAAMMIEHHQQAIEMSDILLAKSEVSPEVAALAQRIKDAQGPEIDRMNAWLEAWGAEPNTADSAGGMHHGDGMMSEEDMQALEAADGPSASKLFLEQMIAHHEGAVEMAESQLADGENSDALELAQQIIDAQTVEIEEMRELLTTL